MENETQHTVSLVDRQNLSLTGIKDVDAFNEQEITAVCQNSELIIRGEMLHIEELNIDSGLMNVSGKINSLTYAEKFSSGSLIKRLFGG